MTVAEVSGDKHAAQLIHSLKQLDPELIIEGLGGPEMAAAGATIHRNTVAKAAMGLRGILRARDVYGLLKWTGHYFDEHRPDLWIGVDSPSMNFHFAKVARERAIPTFQYVAPQLWAWAPWRMKKLRRWVDQMACILPFEESYFRAHGVNATFVGHPLFDELPEGRREAKAEDRNGALPTVGLLPGSRSSEAQHNFPRMLQIADRLRQEFPRVKFLVPTTDGTHPVVERLLRKGSVAGAFPEDFEVAKNAFDRFVPRCDLCITVSGTATLHVASFNVPMIVVYRASPLLWHIGGRWLVRSRTMALVNVLGKQTTAQKAVAAGGHIVPEFIPWLGSSERVSELAVHLLKHPEELEAQRERLARLIRTLDRPGASMNVAKLVMGMIEKRECSDRAGGESGGGPSVLPLREI